MFFSNQPDEQKEKYYLLLKIVGALSKLSSDNGDIPYLYYRMAENIFCKAFNARNLSRSDISLDASKEIQGIGLKTFLHKNGRPIEKIAEFNKDRASFAGKSSVQIINAISHLRNERLRTTGGICDINVNNMLYHCISREKGKFLIYETPMQLINLEGLKVGREANNVISFNDGLNDYSFNLSKSTLFKKFIVEPVEEIDVKIFEDPYEVLERYLAGEFDIEPQQANPIVATIYLPLYSEKGGIHVPTQSQLNQWNANGRARNNNEAYIPIPIEVRRKYPSFFPAKDTSFTLQIPNGSSLCAKVCQENGKALMTNPNSALGQWLLRDVLKLDEEQLLTYEMLEEKGIDSVEISKYEDGTYEINFKKTGTYQAFKDSYLK
ncbi:MAG: NgoFVII family restriction endonuclease [Alphaproteobacteria bacterium]